MAKPRKKNIFPSILAFSIYLFFILGFVFHSSAHPVIFGKYTIKYFFLLFGLIVFTPFLFIIAKRLFLKISKKTGIIFFIIILLVVVSISEIYLRIQYKNYES